MRIATLQFAPKLGDVKGNIETANALLKKGKTISVEGKQIELGLTVDLLKPDVLVLPEMAFTGTYRTWTRLRPLHPESAMRMA
jgi:protein N-terminal amidase